MKKPNEIPVIYATESLVIKTKRNDKPENVIVVKEFEKE